MHDHYKNRTLTQRAAEKKRSIEVIRAVLLLAVLAATLFAARDTLAQQGEYSIEIEGIELPTDEPYEMRDLVLFMPLDDSVLSALGADLTIVSCGADCFSVSAYGGTVHFQVGSGEIIVDSESRGAPAAFKMRDVYYIPAWEFFRAIDFDTSWDEANGVLQVGYSLLQDTAQDRLATVLDIAGSKAAEPEKVQPPAATGESSFDPYDEYYLDYTYENTTQYDYINVNGDSTQSRTKEKNDIYDKFNIRFMGKFRNGYDFMSVIRTQFTSDEDINHGELKKFELAWSRDTSIKLSLYDIQPKYETRYIMRNHLLQGVNYKRTNNKFTWQMTAGKSPKSLRRSKYARYVAAMRISRDISKRKDAGFGFTLARTQDSGGYMDNKKKENYVGSFDLHTEMLSNWKVSAEAAASYDRLKPGNTSQRGKAVLYQASRSTRRTSFKSAYERTGSGFYSPTSSFTRGRTEFSSLYNLKISSTSLLGLGARHKKIRDRTTVIYPASLSFMPLPGRSNFRMTMNRNFEKTTGGRERIIDTRELQVRDVLGSNTVDLRVSRQKNKVPGSQLAYREKRQVTVRSILSDRFSSYINVKNERWKMDRVSVSRQKRIKLEFEPKAWTEMSVEFDRYYNTPKSARTTTKLDYHKMDIYKDAEWKFQFRFDNYRDFNTSKVSLSYSFFK